MCNKGFPILDVKCTDITKRFLNIATNYVVMDTGQYPNYETDVITKEHYISVIAEHYHITNLIIGRATKMAMIKFGRKPVGICTDTDFERRNGKLLVRFEKQRYGELDYDLYEVPLDYIFDPDWVEKYEAVCEEEKREEEKQRALRESAKKVFKVFEPSEEHDQLEYQRLKKKYEKEEVA